MATIEISEKELKKISEGMLLTLVITEYSISHPLEKPHNSIASICNVTTQAIRDWEVDKGHPGVVRWLKIEKLTGTLLFKKWYESIRKNGI